MKYLVILLPLIIFANPILVTYFNEVQASPDSLERIELYDYYGGGRDLSNWRIVTRAGEATINEGVILPPRGYVVIDRNNTSGIFSLANDCDSILLISNEGDTFDFFTYPYVGRVLRGSSGPTPPDNGSVSFYRINLTFSFNWYIDSSPTFGYQNDDWSSISGRVIDQGGNLIPYVAIVASGPMGEMGYDRMGDPINEPYFLPGLGAGKYLLGALLYQPRVWVYYPESINLGYNQHLTDINIVYTFPGLKEVSSIQSFNIPLYDALGEKVTTKINLPKGVYFLNLKKGIRKLVFYK